MLLLEAYFSLIYLLNKQLWPLCNGTNILYQPFSHKKRLSWPHLSFYLGMWFQRVSQHYLKGWWRLIPLSARSILHILSLEAETGAAHLPFQPSWRGKALSKTTIVSVVPILRRFRRWPTLLVPSSSFGFRRITVLKMHMLCGQGWVGGMLLVVRWVVQVSPCSWESMSN